jgi:metal-responsive CopG/Arc/MetJ family transcriptional regulator
LGEPPVVARKETAMTQPPSQTAAVNLPADLLAKMEEMKQYREQDRDRPVADIIRDMCLMYIRVREKVREERERSDEINRSYELDPYDCRDDYYAEGEQKEQAG